jgi:hypothetical protein
MVKEGVNILSTKSMKEVIKGRSKHPDKQTVPAIVPQKWQMTTEKELPPDREYRRQERRAATPPLTD